MRCPSHGHDRRVFLGLLTVGLAATLTGCSQATAGSPSRSLAPDAKVGGDSGQPNPIAPAGAFPPVPAAHPGVAQELKSGPANTQQVALTVDDGFCDDCVKGYVDFVQRTGIHLTFSPNGVYAPIWNKQAPRLRPLVESGQVQIMNHTFSHKDLRKLNPLQIRTELERNDEWVVKTFGITTRPYYRPPFGFHNPQTDGVAAELGYTRTVMWNGSYGDANLLTPDVLMGEARKWMKAGTIMLGHANHPTVLGLFDQIQQLIKDRNLQPVTLDEMFGTSRATG